MGLGAGERGLGNHACPSFPLILDPISPSILLGTTGPTGRVSQFSMCVEVYSSSLHPLGRICFVGVWVSAGPPKKRPPPPPPLFRHLSLLHAPIDPRISRPKHAAPELHPVLSCEVGNPTVLWLQARSGGPRQVISFMQVRKSHTRSWRPARKKKKLRTKAGDEDGGLG